MKNTMPKTLVFGGQSGLLGQALVGAITNKGWDVVSSVSSDLDFYSSSISSELAAFIDKRQPDCIFNTVAYTQVDKAEEDENRAMIINKNLPAHLAKICKERGIKLVHYSTDFVFDGRKSTLYTVDDQPNPVSAYGRSKYSGEQAIVESGLEDYCIIRTAWLYGSGKKNFVTTILNTCREHGSARVVFDQIGSPTYAKDLADYSLALVDLKAKGLFHIVNSGQASWCELAGEAANYAQLECQINPVSTADFGSQVPRPAYSVLDTTSFTQITGIVPRAWPQALREYLMLDLVSGPE